MIIYMIPKRPEEIEKARYELLNRKVIIASKQELEVNRKNRENYEQLMKESSTQLDGYWDSNNPFVKILLIGLFVLIVVGAVAILVPYFTNK